MSPLIQLSLEEVHALAMTVLRVRGVTQAQARAVADSLAAAERDECRSHGLFRLPGYALSAESGNARLDAVPQVTDLAPGVVRVDACEGFAPLALEAGHRLLVRKAREQGIAALAIVNSRQFAALWPEAEALATEGLVAFAFVSSLRYVAPAGGSRPLYGTNPMAFAWPRDGHPPVVFDQASSASARGEIQLHLRDGMPIPVGWAVDAEGRSTTDPAAALDGAQLPFGGYKGAAIALMVELLAGALVGDSFSFETAARDNLDGGPPARGELVIAIDPGRCVPASERSIQLAHAELLFEQILAQDGTRLPSDRRYAARRRTQRDGVTVPRMLHEELVRLQSPHERVRELGGVA